MTKLDRLFYQNPPPKNSLLFLPGLNPSKIEFFARIRFFKSLLLELWNLHWNNNLFDILPSQVTVFFRPKNFVSKSYPITPNLMWGIRISHSRNVKTLLWLWFSDFRPVFLNKNRKKFGFLPENRLFTGFSMWKIVCKHSLYNKDNQKVRNMLQRYIINISFIKTTRT